MHLVTLFDLATINKSKKSLHKQFFPFIASSKKTIKTQPYLLVDLLFVETCAMRIIKIVLRLFVS